MTARERAARALDPWINDLRGQDAAAMLAAVEEEIGKAAVEVRDFCVAEARRFVHDNGRAAYNELPFARPRSPAEIEAAILGGSGHGKAD